MTLASLPEDAGFFARLYPGMPLGWMLGRLLCLAAAAALLASCARAVGAAARDGEPDPVAEIPPPPPAVSRTTLGLAAALAFAQVAVAPFADRLDRPGQLVYLAGFLVPAAVLWAGGARSSGTFARSSGTFARSSGTFARSSETFARSSGTGARSSGTGARPGKGTAILVGALLAWAGARAALSVHSLRAADPVDTWFGLEFLQKTVDGELNLLAEGLLPGVTALHLVPQGAGLYGSRLAPSFLTVQGVHLFWLTLLGGGVALLARRFVGGHAAPVAAAAFLCSPFVLMMPLNPSPLFLGAWFGVGLALLLDAFHRRRNLAALAGLGALVGVAGTHPSTVPVGLLACVAVGLSLWRGPRVPILAVAIPLASATAAVLPAFPDLETLGQMRDAYARGQGHWFELEPSILGRHSPFGVNELNEAGRAGPFDVAVGALLSPFATPRTSLRLWGDTAFDPLGGGLAALGIAACLRAGRRRPGLAALLVFLAVGVAPGFLSSYDRPSLGRMFVAPVPLALLAGLGFEVLRRGLVPRAPGRWLAAAMAVAIAATGFFLFDRVNPRILAPSSVGLALRALEDGRPLGGALFLQHGPPFDFAWLQVRPIARHVPAEPLPVFDYEGVPSLALAAERPTPPAEVMFWSAGLEEDGKIASVICRFWPDTALYLLEDPAGRSRTYAARPAGPAWRPAESGLRFRMRPCGDLGRAAREAG